MELLVVARSSEDRHHVILRWGKHYGVVEKGMKPSQVKWGKKDILDRSLTGKNFEEVEPPVVFRPVVKKSLSSGLTLYLDVRKSHQLNFGHLVKRAVQVKGKNGKQFTRMQWVNPGQASTGHGVRRINNSKDWLNAVGDGVMKHPMHKQAMEDQGVDMDKHHIYGEHPAFFVPETAESRKGKTGRDFIPHKDSEFSKRYNENQESISSETKSDVDKGIIRTEVSELLRDYKAGKSLAPVFDSMESMFLKGTTRQKYLSLREGMSKHWKTLHPQIEESISSSNSSEYAKKIQLSTLDRISKMTDSGKDGVNKDLAVMASHPAVAKYAVDKLLGRERANVLRANMRDGNLTINTSQKHLDSILKDGYVANTSEDYVRSRGTKRDIREYNKIADSNVDMDAKLEMIQDIIDSDPSEERNSPSNIMWRNISDRAEAEYLCMGLDIGDNIKPNYLAFNPDGSSLGACTSYGDGTSIKLNSSILKDCTGNMSDTFYKTRPIAKIHDMDHLKDIYMLRMMHDAQGGGDIFKDIPEWANGDHMWPEDVPVELHYHKPRIDPELISVNGNRPDSYEDYEEEDEGKYDNWG